MNILKKIKNFHINIKKNTNELESFKKVKIEKNKRDIEDELSRQMKVIKLIGIFIFSIIYW